MEAAEQQNLRTVTCCRKMKAEWNSFALDVIKMAFKDIPFELCYVAAL